MNLIYIKTILYAVALIDLLANKPTCKVKEISMPMSTVHIINDQVTVMLASINNTPTQY